MSLRMLAVALATLALAACSSANMTPEADAMAKGVFTALRTGADLSNDPRLAADIRTPQGMQQLEGVRALIPEAEPQGVENRAFNVSTNTSGGRAELTHAYRYAGGSLIVQTILLKPPGAQTWVVAGMDVRREGAPPQRGGAPAAQAPPAAAPPEGQATPEEAPAAEEGGGK